MASSSTPIKSIIALVIFNLLFLSHASYAPPPSYAQPPSYAELPKLCNFDDLYKPGGEHIFDDIETCNIGLFKLCKFNEIYQFGDSISDVGNLIREMPATPLAIARLPYGANFPMGPTGRASNGNLMIDYFAMDAGLPLLPPFKKWDADFSHGVNFAVAGSTALPWEALAALNISSPVTNTSLSVQLDSLSAYFCSTQKDSGEKLENSLFMLGPFGGSDYHYALFQGKTIHEIETTLVPKVVNAIMAAVGRVINLGARKVVVPGLYTIFRLPIYRTAFGGNNDMFEASDDLAIYHNALLQRAIDKFNQEESPNAMVTYGDYFTAYERLETYAVGLMDLMVCCGSGGGSYNLDLTRMCGADGVSACAEPNKHISWDGENLTQEAYRIMTKYLLHHIFVSLQCPYSY
ncbi:acetylajmalan esterase-like [Salvia miltiorrhiza]|uniref:acetylajmalan esterase-like n=1 Tax=Salvia miltiorrhiza TaxID=226208 RepID=UPI0025AB636E|nr:acetylajmalan esterase-like [Salvia miltiorrhiza]